MERMNFLTNVVQEEQKKVQPMSPFSTSSKRAVMGYQIATTPPNVKGKKPGILKYKHIHDRFSNLAQSQFQGATLKAPSQISIENQLESPKEPAEPPSPSETPAATKKVAPVRFIVEPEPESHNVVEVAPPITPVRAPRSRYNMQLPIGSMEVLSPLLIGKTSTSISKSLGMSPVRLKRRYTRKEIKKDSQVQKNHLQQALEQEQPVPPYFVNPNGVFRKIWESIRFVLLIYTLLYLPLRMAFTEAQGGMMYTVDKLVDVFFLSDILFTFCMPVSKNYEFIYNRKQIAKEYLLGWFAADFLSIFPFEEILMSAASEAHELHTLSRITKALRLIRLMKLMRLFKAANMKASDNYILIFVESQIGGTGLYTIFPNLIFMTFTIHLLTCIWYYTASVDESNLNWIYLNGFQDRSKPDIYVLGMYLVVQSFTTCGYGDILSVLNIEKVERIFFIFIGTVLYGIFSGRMMAYRVKQMQEEELYILRSQHLDRIDNEYAFSTRVSLWLQQNLKDHKKDVKKRAYDFSNLSPEEIEELDYLKFISKFKDIPLFTRDLIKADFVLELGRLVESKTYEKGDYIYYKGEYATYFYILAQGSVAITMDMLDTIPIYEIKKGYFGEYEIIFPMKRQYNMIAKTDCRVYRLECSNFKRIFLDDPEDLILCFDITRQAEQRVAKIEETKQSFESFLKRQLFWKLEALKSQQGEKNSKRILQQVESKTTSTGNTVVHSNLK